MLLYLTFAKAIKDKKLSFFLNNIIVVLLFSFLYFIFYHFEKNGLVKENMVEHSEITYFDCLHFSFAVQTTNGHSHLFINSYKLKFINIIHYILLLAMNLIHIY
jgi:uncharacterized membrane-anchored protein